MAIAVKADKLRKIGFAVRSIDRVRTAHGAIRIFDLETGEDIEGIINVELLFDVNKTVRARIELIVQNLECLDAAGG